MALGSPPELATTPPGWPDWQSTSPGAVFSALAWLGGSAQQSWHLGSFANCDATDGSFGAEPLPGVTKRAPTTEAYSKSAPGHATLRIIEFVLI